MPENWIVKKQHQLWKWHISVFFTLRSQYDIIILSWQWPWLLELGEQRTYTLCNYFRQKSFQVSTIFTCKPVLHTSHWCESDEIIMWRHFVNWRAIYCKGNIIIQWIIEEHVERSLIGQYFEVLEKYTYS